MRSTAQPIPNANLRVGEFDDFSVEVGARSVVREAEERYFAVVERGIAEIARVR